jgi:hypothetical protein
MFLFALAAILVGLWIYGMAIGLVMAGALHVLLALAALAAGTELALRWRARWDARKASTKIESQRAA